MQITQRTEEMVYPARPISSGQLSHPLLHKLSEVDQQYRGMAIPYLFFFEGGSSEGNSRALKESLGEVLCVFYPLAGRLVEREGGGGTRMDVKCEDQGAVFCEAWADSPLSYFGNPPDDVQPHPDISLLVPLPRCICTPEDALLHVQVTHFICGGLCLCIQENHTIVDGVANAHFMEFWVDILNGKRSMTLYPYMDTSLLKNEYKSIELSSQHSKRSVPPNLGNQSSSTYISKVFHLTPSLIEALREDGRDVSHRPTTFECISAHLWQTITRVQKLDPKEDIQLVYVVNGRHRFDPPLPLGYFGNAIFVTRANAKVEDLMNEPLSYAINLIKEATSRVSSDFMKMRLDSFENQQPIPTPPLKQRFIGLTTWVNFGLCDLKFPWGKPCCLRSYYDPHVANDWAVLLPSSLGKGHVDLQVLLKPEHMYTFETLIEKPPLRKT